MHGGHLLVPAGGVLKLDLVAHHLGRHVQGVGPPDRLTGTRRSDLQHAVDAAGAHGPQARHLLAVTGSPPPVRTAQRRSWSSPSGPTTTW